MSEMKYSNSIGFRGKRYDNAGSAAEKQNSKLSIVLQYVDNCCQVSVSFGKILYFYM